MSKIHEPCSHSDLSSDFILGGALSDGPVVVHLFNQGYTLYRNDGLGGVLRFSYEGDMDGTSDVELTIGGLVEGRQQLACT